MTTPPPRPRRLGKRRNERGAVLVELALCAALLIVITLGIVDYGTLFTDKISLKGGAREAVWNGGRQIFGSAVDCGLTGVGSTPNPTGDLNTKRLMCMAKTRSDLPSSEMRVRVEFVNIESPATPGTYAPGSGLMVCIMRQAHSVSGLFSFTLDNTYQTAKLVGLIQNASAPGLTELAETPFAGQSWNFCDPTAAAST